MGEEHRPARRVRVEQGIYLQPVSQAQGGLRCRCLRPRPLGESGFSCVGFSCGIDQGSKTRLQSVVAMLGEIGSSPTGPGW